MAEPSELSTSVSEEIVESPINALVAASSSVAVETTTDDNSSDTTQDLATLKISEGFAGIVVFGVQLAKRGALSREAAFDFIRQFYEFDTGEFLRPTQIMSLFSHPKVMAYDAAIMPNVMRKHIRRQQADLAALEEKMKSQGAVFEASESKQ